MSTLKQSQFVGYILAGVLICLAGLARAPDLATVEELGALAVTVIITDTFINALILRALLTKKHIK